MECVLKEQRHRSRSDSEWIKHKIDDSQDFDAYFAAKPSTSLELRHPRLRLVRFRNTDVPAMQAIEKLNMQSELFDLLASRWYDDVRFKSGEEEILEHPACRAIISLGEQAIPHILKKVAADEGRWFTVLASITDENPVPAESRGIKAETKEAWLEWGRRHRFI